MSLKDLDIKNEYRSKLTDIVYSFFIPVLNESIVYKRSVGFFSSSSLIEVSKGICNLAKKEGQIKLVTSPCLSEEDIEAIKNGYKDRNEVIKGALFRELKEPSNETEYDRLDLLAQLIARGTLDIKVAVVEDDLGIYHEKLGIMEDNEGNFIAFSGSMNESETAIRRNYETIDVFCSWEAKDVDRAIEKSQAFDAIWGGYEGGIEVISFPELSEEIISRYKRKNSIDFSLDKKEFKNSKIMDKCRNLAVIPLEIELREYQNEAIDNWKENKYIGIFDMATGTGKTLTALGAITKLSDEINGELGVVIVCPYQHLVEQWVEDIVKFNISPIIGYSSSIQRDWKNRLSQAVRDQKLRADKKFFCFICTNATFTNGFVQEQLSKAKYPLLLVVDEAHNFGARSLANLLDNRCTYRLALSATLERHRDEEGTEILYNYFGKKCIEYSLERAIKEEKLTPYKYYPILVFLDEEELEKYEQLSFELSKHIKKNKNGRVVIDSYGEILAIKRSRIIAGATNKLEKLVEVITPYKNESFLLVYCGATHVIAPSSDVSEVDENEIRQIEAVTRILGKNLSMKVSKFTSEENIEERNAIKQHFKNGDDLQAIVAIKCLDEGVNIPSIKTAFILASTTNPKEYIQRRGRVLRKSPETGKTFAEIYDFVTLPRSLDEVSGLTEESMKRDISLVKNELRRVIEFCSLSMNAMEGTQLVWDVCDCYNLPYNFDELEEEWDNG